VVEAPGANVHVVSGQVDDRWLRRRTHQVTSPAPARRFATRASMNRRSERRLR
jgi:hypothetical protein